MKQLDTSFIGINIDQYILKGTLDHLQESYQDIFDALGNFLQIDNYSAFVPYILYGCEYSESGGNWTINAGVIYYGHKFYYFDSVTKAITGGQVPVLSYATTYASCDPTPFSDGSTHSVHQIIKLKADNGTTGSGLVDFSTSVRLNSPQVGIQSGLTWGSSQTINFEHNQRLFYSSSLGTGGALLLNFTSPAIGCKKHMYGAISAGGQIGLSAAPYNVIIKMGGYITFQGDNSLGGNVIVFTTGGNFCLEIEYLGKIGTLHQVSITVIGN